MPSAPPYFAWSNPLRFPVQGGRPVLIAQVDLEGCCCEVVQAFNVDFFNGSSGGNAVVGSQTVANPFRYYGALVLIEDITGINPALGRGQSMDDDLRITAPSGTVYLYGGGSPQTWTSGRLPASTTRTLLLGQSLLLELIDTVGTGYQCQVRISISPIAI
jgi:hypothetical protein